MKSVRVALIGIGGFGNLYVNALLREPKRDGYEIAGACDPRPEGCRLLGELRAAGVPVFDTPETLFTNVSADMAVISTPIFLHPAHAALAFANGCHVLLEKPVAATAEDARSILRARDEAGKLLAIGFQWCYDASMRAFKNDILAGRFGRLVSMKALVLWPRDLAYYARGGGWAGKRYSADGRALFDSVASNATAHYIMNMLWLAGDSAETAATLGLSRALALRVNDIETFDTVAFEGTLAGARVFYAASHAVGPEDNVNPVFEYRFERALATFSEDDGGNIRLTAPDGRTVAVYPKSVPNGANVEKLWQMMDAVRINDGPGLPCPGEAALAHAQAMDLLNVVPVCDARSRRVHDEERNAYVLPGLGATLKRAYAEASVPAEL